VITGGETNTASNVGIVGVGIFKQKTGVDLEFKKLNAGSNKVTITDDVGNNEIDVDVVVANLTGIAQSQVTNLTTDLSNKQETLVSGTNIKTINSTSLLGSGDISIDLSVKQTNIQFQNKGVSLGTSGTVDVINFTGAPVTASRTGNTVTVDVTGGGGGGATNLAYNASPTNGVITSDTGTDATIPLADGTNAGLLAPAQFTKLSNIAITQPVDLDQLESDTATNNAKVSNATHTGDVSGSTILTLATVNSNVGTFGSGTQIPQFVVNGKGLITSVSNVTITPAASSITGAGNITKVDDTNVTLTLGGTPTGSVLNSVSFTLGWTGTLADGRIASASNWNNAYSNRITSLTTTGNSGASTLISNVLNIPNYTLAGLGGISLTSLSSTATGLTYTNTTGVFSLTSGYVIPTTTQETNWNTAYTNRITSLTTTGSSGAATLISNVLNIPTYTLAGLGGQPLDADLTAIAALTGTSGFLKTNGAGTWTVDTNTYLTGNQSITLSGEASGSGTTGISVTLSNSAVINKVLTGFTSTTGTILATDSILQAIQKLDGNLAAATAGGVSSVTGTTNRITSTGGSNPIIDISASYVGQSSITTLGTISTGVWQGTVVDELYGGTGIGTYTTGDILYSSATNTLAKLPISTNGKVLTITAGIPSWETPTSGVTDHTALSNLVWASSSHTGTASRIAGFNGSGAPSYYQIGVDLQGYDTTLNALASYNTNGILTQTGADTFVGRSLQGTTDRITLTNGNGVLGNPTVDISSNYVGQSSITTLGTITTGVWNGTAIGDSYISSASTWNLKQAGIQFQDEGSNLGTSNTVTGINFTGNGISASRTGNIITVDVGATSGVTNLTYTPSASNGIVVSDTGSDATIPAATTLIAGLMIPAQFDKLANITITQAVDLDALESDVADLTTLSGVASNSTTLGTFTGTTIPDSSTIKAALQSLETTLETNYTVTNRQNKIRVVSINTTLSATTDGTVVFDTAGTVATLPSPTNELMLVVKNVSNGSITVTGHLDGVAAQTFTIASLESFRFHSNGSTYYIIA
jgi:hypothetical protein